jgi:hypothetical protein
MGLAEFILALLVAVGPLAGGLGYAMLGLSPPNYRAIRAMFWVSGIAFWSAGIMWAVAAPGQPLGVRLSIAGVVGCISAVGLAYFLIETGLREKLRADELKPGPIVMAQNQPPIYHQDIRSYNQSGGITAGNVTIGQIPRSLDAGLQAQILREMPRDKAISVTAVAGDSEAMNLASQVYEFMKANGFHLKDGGVSQSFFTAPVKGLVVQPQGDGLVFIVGANLPP